MAYREHNFAVFQVGTVLFEHSNNLTDRHAVDKVLAEKARKRAFTANDSVLSERVAAVWASMKAKTKIGMNMKEEEDKEKSDEKADTSNGETRCVTVWLAQVGAASVAKAINDSKAARCQLEELQHHDRAME